MRVLTVDSVEAFMADIEAATDLSLLKEMHGRPHQQLARHLIKRIEKIDTLCEKFRKSFMVVHAEPLESLREYQPKDDDQEYLIQIRDKSASREMMHLAGCLLRLTYEVRYPNEPEEVKTINPPTGERFFNRAGKEISRPHDGDKGFAPLSNE